jgi:hypothetical protein
MQNKILNNYITINCQKLSVAYHYIRSKQLKRTTSRHFEIYLCSVTILEQRIKGFVRLEYQHTFRI